MKPVINREIVVHRQNTVIRNITLHKVNTTNKLEVEPATNRQQYAQGSTRVVNERREVRGVNCNCGYDGNGSAIRHQVSYRY